jgi:hypothetical protein
VLQLKPYAQIADIGGRNNPIRKSETLSDITNQFAEVRRRRLVANTYITRPLPEIVIKEIRAVVIQYHSGFPVEPLLLFRSLVFKV